MKSMNRLRSDDKNGFTLVVVLVFIAVLALIGLTAWLVYRHDHNSSNSSTNSTVSTSNNGTTSSSLQPPAIPASGKAYLGAWVNPGSGTGTGSGNNTGAPGSNELSKLPAFNQSLGGKSVAILHVWTGFKASVPTSTLNAIKQNGSIPLVNWGCTNVNNIASGQEDSVITAYAQGLKAYGSPVFLRWYWEMNVLNKAGGQPAGSSCEGYNNGPAFVSAWRHIYNLFQQVGATNVAFVWCPGYAEGNFSAYYPGDQYVNWIGVDRYVRANSPSDFSGMFSPYYDQWVSHNKPIMVAETAAMPPKQANYISSIQTQASSLPDIKAVVYFDSIGPAGDWSLQGAGVSDFKMLNSSSYFSN